MDTWAEETFNGLVRLGLRVKAPIVRARSAYQTIEIVDTEPYGVTLLLDGAMMTSAADEFFYHEMLVHPAMTTAPRIRRVLIVGGGDGGTVREVLRYREVEQVVLCEIDAKVTELCRAHLGAFRVPWDDPRLTLNFADGVAYLREAGELFDIILIDGSDPVGPAAGLFTSPFYESCRARLAPGGILALQSEAPFLMRDEFLRIVRMLRGVFTSAHPYFGPVPIYPSGSWSFTIASDGTDAFTPRSDRLDRIEPGCRFYNREIHLAAFALPSDLRRELDGGGSPPSR